VSCVLQFRPGETRPALTLGERFRPGGGQTRLCQPTAVAVATSGHVFVADGYCNHRVLTFNQRGRLLRLIPLPSGEMKAASTLPIRQYGLVLVRRGKVPPDFFSLFYDSGRTL
jgi:hypothetical protein